MWLHGPVLGFSSYEIPYALLDAEDQKNVPVNKSTGKSRKAKPIGELIGQAMEPALRKRGFATADLLTHWEDLVGGRYCSLTRPEKLIWPRTDPYDPDQGHKPAALVLACDSGAAVFIQHELDQIRERINGFFGYAVVDRIKLIQKPFDLSEDQAMDEGAVELTDDQTEGLKAATEPIRDDGLREAVNRLGRAVIANASRKPDRRNP